MNALCKNAVVLDVFSHLGTWGVNLADGMGLHSGASEVMMLDDSLAFAQMAAQNVQANKVDTKCTVLHRADIIAELETMALASLKFNVVTLSPRVAFQRYFKQRRGQFGRWFKPSLVGLERLVKEAALVTAKGGYLVFNVTLPQDKEHWARNLFRRGLDKAGRTGAIIFESGATGDHPVLVEQGDFWYSRVLVARLD